MNDEAEFLTFVKDALHEDEVRLERLPVRCTSLVYRAEMRGRPPVFVKRLSWCDNPPSVFLRRAPRNRLLPKLAGEGIRRFGTDVVFFFEWAQGQKVTLERMDERQFAELRRGYAGLLGLVRDIDPATVRPRRDPVADLAFVQSRLNGSLLARSLARPLAALAPRDVTYPTDVKFRVVHGDFHCRNYWFLPDGGVSFFDLDTLTWGTPEEDLVQAFAQRFRRSGLGLGARRILTARFRQVMEESDSPTGVWRTAVNVARVRAAADMLREGNRGVRGVLNVGGRDRNLRRLLKTVGAGQRARSAHRTRRA